MASQAVTNEQFVNIKEDLTNIFKDFKWDNFELKCLALTDYNDCSDCVPLNIPSDLLIGTDNAYEEIILGKKFRVSHSAFLQIHIE